MPRAKKPETAKIVPDGANRALRVLDVAEADEVYRGKFSDPNPADRIFGYFQFVEIAAGIRSLVAERDMLRKLVKEAYMKGALDQSHRCGLAGREKTWEVSGFPEKIEKGAF